MNPTLQAGDHICMEIEGEVLGIATGARETRVLPPELLAAAKITVLPPEWKVGDVVQLVAGSGTPIEIVAPPRMLNGCEARAVGWTDNYGYQIYLSSDLERLP